MLYYTTNSKLTVVLSVARQLKKKIKIVPIYTNPDDYVSYVKSRVNSTHESFVTQDHYL